MSLDPRSVLLTSIAVALVVLPVTLCYWVRWKLERSTFDLESGWFGIESRALGSWSEISSPWSAFVGSSSAAR